MEHTDILPDLDEHERKIIEALGNMPLQNIYMLEKNAKVSRRAIYGRIGGRYQLKKKKSLVERGYLKEKKGPKLQTGHKKRLFGLTFKGEIAAYAINDGNKNIRNGLIKYMGEFGLKSIDCFCGILKLWLGYKFQSNPGEFENQSSRRLREAVRSTIWNGLRHAIWEVVGRAAVGGLPERPFLGLFPVSLYFLKGHGLTRDEIVSLEKYLAVKEVLSSEGMMLDLLDKQLKLKHQIESAPVDKCTLYGGCLIIQLESELKEESQRKRFEEVVSDPSGRIEIRGLSGDVGIHSVCQIRGICDNEETSCPHKDSGEMLDRIACERVREEMFG